MQLLALSDTELDTAMVAAAPLNPRHRDPFFRAVANLLRAEKVLCDSVVSGCVSGRAKKPR
jgi:hypothetical protein